MPCSLKVMISLHHASDWHDTIEVSVGLTPESHDTVPSHKPGRRELHYQTPTDTAAKLSADLHPHVTFSA